MSKRNRINAAIATALAISAIAASMPGASQAQKSHTGAQPTVEPGGGGH